MIKAKEMLESGQLTAAISEMTQAIKAKPADVTYRLFFWELLCFAGDYERAGKQLEVAGHLDDKMRAGIQVYIDVMGAEKKRRGVFAQGHLPDFLAARPEFASLYLEAWTMRREKLPAKAKALLAGALDLQAPISGQVDGKSFQGFEDSDLFLGPFLEIMLKDRYIWLPFTEIRRIQLAKPTQLRDLLWIRALVETHSGSSGEVFVPALYPGSSEHPEDAVKLGRITDWVDLGEGLAQGAGQRMFAIDDEERAMLEVNDISFNSDHEQERA